MEDKIKILIAQDEKTCLEMSEFFDMSNEFEVVGTTNNGNILINYIVNKEPDLIIMDFILQDKDGLSVLDYVKNNLALAKKPKIIMFSRLSHDVFIVRALELGATYFVLKPCDFRNLKDRIFDLIFSKPSLTTSSFNEDITGKLLEEKISNIFISVGIPVNVKGYQFLREAIKIVLNKPEIINSITKKLYPSIAEVFDTNASKVERAIRHSIEIAWNRGKIININKLFGIKVIDTYEKPTNSEFIALVADKIKHG